MVATAPDSRSPMTVQSSVAETATGRGAVRGGRGAVAGVDEAGTAAGKSGSKKDDAVVRFGGVENQSDVVARMNAAARQGYRSAERRLLVLSHSLNLGRASVHVTYRQRRESSGPAV